jgi:hypothetical protein
MSKFDKKYGLQPVTSGLVLWFHSGLFHNKQPGNPNVAPQINIDDLSGTGNNGLLQNIGVTGSTVHTGNNTLATPYSTTFSAATSSILVPNSSSLQFTSAFTFDFWVLLSGYGGNNSGRLLDKNTAADYAMNISSSNNVTLNIGGTSYGSSANEILTSPFVIQNFVVRFDTTLATNQIEHRMNNQTWGYGTRHNTNCPTSSADLYIFNRLAGDRNCPCSMMSVKLYNRYLSNSELTQNYNQGLLLKKLFLENKLVA